MSLPRNTWLRRAPAVLAVLLLSVPSARGVQRHLSTIRGDVAGWLAAAGFEMVYLSTSVLLLRRSLRHYAQRTALAAVAVAVVFNSLADYSARVPDGLASFGLFAARFDGLALALSIMDSLPLAGLSYAMATLLHRLSEDEAQDAPASHQINSNDTVAHEHTTARLEPVTAAYALPSQPTYPAPTAAHLAPAQVHSSSSRLGEMHMTNVQIDAPTMHRTCGVCGVELDIKRYASGRRWKRCPECKAPWN